MGTSATSRPGAATSASSRLIVRVPVPQSELLSLGENLGREVTVEVKVESRYVPVEKDHATGDVEVGRPTEKERQMP